MEVDGEGYIASFEARWARGTLWALAVLGWALCATAWVMAAYWMVSNIMCTNSRDSCLLPCSHTAVGRWMGFLSVWSTMALAGTWAVLSVFLLDEWRQPVARIGAIKIK